MLIRARLSRWRLTKPKNKQLDPGRSRSTRPLYGSLISPMLLVSGSFEFEERCLGLEPDGSFFGVELKALPSDL